MKIRLDTRKGVLQFHRANSEPEDRLDLFGHRNPLLPFSPSLDQPEDDRPQHPRPLVFLLVKDLQIACESSTMRLGIEGTPDHVQQCTPTAFSVRPELMSEVLSIASHKILVETGFQTAGQNAGHELGGEDLVGNVQAAAAYETGPRLTSAHDGLRKATRQRYVSPPRSSGFGMRLDEIVLG